ncbi:hypothetical protein D9M71_584290 [compost metagenome]
MKGHKTGMSGDRTMQCADIAVANKRLGVFAQHAIVEPLKQADTAVPTAQADNCIHIIRGERRMQIRQPRRVATRQITLNFGYPRIDPALITTRLEPLDRLERIELGRPSGCDDGDTAILWQRLWQH